MTLIARFMAAMLLGAAIPAFAAAGTVDEAKAAFLFRFASYVEWPAEAADDGHFVIAIVDGRDVASRLEKLVTGMQVRGKPVEVRRVSRSDELRGVHILYVGPGALPRTRVIRVRAAKLPVLMVTDRKDGIEAGGVINFLSSGREVRFEVSLIAADRAGLSIDSALLSVAARVERRPEARLPEEQRDSLAASQKSVR